MTVKWHFQVPKRMVHIHKIKDITISASGKAKDKTFTTQTKTIKTSDLKYNTEITLNFDSEDIEDYVEKKEKEENSLKNKLIEFCWIFFSE